VIDSHFDDEKFDGVDVTRDSRFLGFNKKISEVGELFELDKVSLQTSVDPNIQKVKHSAHTQNKYYTYIKSIQYLHIILICFWFSFMNIVIRRKWSVLEEVATSCWRSVLSRFTKSLERNVVMSSKKM
jgi:hypothetical protein